MADRALRDPHSGRIGRTHPRDGDDRGYRRASAREAARARPANREELDAWVVGAPVVGCDVGEDCAQIRASALGPADCQAIGPNSASNDFLSSSRR